MSHYMQAWQQPTHDFTKQSASTSEKLYKLTKKTDNTEYFVMYKKGVKQLKTDGAVNGYDVTEGPFPEGTEATYTLIDYFDIDDDKDVFRLERLPASGGRRSKKRPTARRRRSSKRNARKARATRRR